MKKILIAVFLSLPFLSSCSKNVETFSFMEATGVEVSNILDITVSPGVAYSTAWPYYGDYSFLNTKYVKEEFNIYDEFFDYPKQDGDDAICLHVTTDILLETYPTQNYIFNLYISKSSHYLYYGSDGDFSFRSLNKISQSTINQLLKQNG